MKIRLSLRIMFLKPSINMLIRRLLPIYLLDVVTNLSENLFFCDQLYFKHNKKDTSNLNVHFLLTYEILLIFIFFKYKIKKLE